MDNWRVYTYTVLRRMGSSDVRCNGNILGSEASTHQGHDLGSRVRQSSLQYRDNTSSDKSKETEAKVGALVSIGILEHHLTFTESPARHAVDSLSKVTFASKA